ncbi:MAG: hypothetical protein CMN28_03770 [Salinisphaeraceae bacterium]|nr:hypothetical protein [Salinisphaeraceae bacterium]
MQGLPSFPAWDRLLRDWPGHRRLYRLTGTDAVAPLLVEHWQGEDGLSASGRLTVTCLAPAGVALLDELLGAPLTLHTRLADGHVCARGGLLQQFDIISSHDAVTRYRLRLVPWLEQLKYSRHNRVFQDRSVPQIVDQLLARYRPEAVWSFDAGVERQPPRSYCVQYEQSDFDFLGRVLGEAGLGFSLVPTTEAPAGHVLRIFDRPEALPEDYCSATTGGLRFQRHAAISAEDAVYAFSNGSRLTPARLSRAHFRYRPRRVLTGQSELASASDRHTDEFYEFEADRHTPTAALAEQRARQRLEELTRDRLYHKGRSGVRSLCSGQRFRLGGHAAGLPSEEGQSSEYLLTHVSHVGINNLPYSARADFDRLLGSDDPVALVDDDALLNRARETGYANRFTAQAVDRPWRPDPPPAARACTQTARVTGPAGSLVDTDEVHVDDLGRIRVRFHWQRGRETDDLDSCWLRCTQMSASGAQFIPRVGQEVLVGFLGGHADHPVVLGAAYNGVGNGGVAPTPGGDAKEDDDAGFQAAHDSRPAGQGARVAGATPAWHGAAAGREEHRNAAALTGFKSRELGGAGFSQLVFDDTDQQHRVQMANSFANSELNLGHLVHQSDNYRGSFRGTGFELRSDAYGAVRAERGVLISSFPADEEQPAGEVTAATQLLESARQSCQALSARRQAHGLSRLVIDDAEQAADTVHSPLAALLRSLQGTLGPAGDAAAIPAVADPLLTIASRAGISMVAGQNLWLHSGEAGAIIAGGSQQHSAGGQWRLQANESISWLSGAGETGGMTIRAGRGNGDLQAQTDALRLTARRALSLRSHSDRVEAGSPESITLKNGAGAALTLRDGNLRFSCPGTLTVHAGQKVFVGPGGVTECASPLASLGSSMPDLRLAPAAFNPAARVDTPDPPTLARVAATAGSDAQEAELTEPAVQIITLRIGVFFDGTGNNMENAIAEACGPRAPDYEGEEVDDITQMCRDMDTQVPEPGGSYGNAVSNIGRLFELYRNDAQTPISQSSDVVHLKTYVEGIGTTTGQDDDPLAMATGMGSTGIIAKASEPPEKLDRQLKLLVANNASANLKIQRVEFDIFGFSRGAAAARHFANEVIKGPQGILALLWRDSPKSFVDNFSGRYSDQLQVKFVGLLDTVPAVVDLNPLSLDVSPANARNAGVRLYLPPGQIERVIQLRAADEEREAFALSQVVPDHEEIVLPGAHSDIGGSYLREEAERLWITRPRTSTVSRTTDPKTSGAFQRAQRDVDAWKRAHPQLAGLPGIRVRVWETNLSRGGRPRRAAQKRVKAVGFLERHVRSELALVYLRIMRELAVDQGVPFEAIGTEIELALPARLNVMYPKLLQEAQTGNSELAMEDQQHLYENYIHVSAHWQPIKWYAPLAAMKPAENYQRIVHPHAPDPI